MLELKRLSKAGVAAALVRADRYRLLCEPGEAESICLDVLEVEPDNQNALLTLVLALTEQFGEDLASHVGPARELLPKWHDEYLRTYYAGIICERGAKAHAGTALRAGHAVIADAVYANPHDRDRIATVARETGVPFIGLWIDGPPELLARRLRERVADASDATGDILQLQQQAGVGRIDWDRLDGSQDAETVQRGAELRWRNEEGQPVTNGG